MNVNSLPEALRNRGLGRVVDVDARPMLARGTDPFGLIMATLTDLAPADVLHLIVGFEPHPLYAVMQQRGRAHITEQRDQAYHVYFYTDRSAASLAHVPAPPTSCRALQPPVDLDVRGLEPPEPLMRILAKLTEIGPGAQLLVQHHRDPVMLHDKLAERGFKAVTTKRGEHDYVVHIMPDWADGGCG